jgi:hypothetical protein
MGPHEQTAGQPVANPVEFRAAYHVPFSLAQQAKYAGNGDDGAPALRREAGKHIPRKERPLHDCDAVGPLYTLGVERQIVLRGAHNQMLHNSLFMVRDHLENMPRRAIHWSLLGESGPEKTSVSVGIAYTECILSVVFVRYSVRFKKKNLMWQTQARA